MKKETKGTNINMKTNTKTKVKDSSDTIIRRCRSVRTMLLIYEKQRVQSNHIKNQKR